jgi:hypothetical protein
VTATLATPVVFYQQPVLRTSALGTVSLSVTAPLSDLDLVTSSIADLAFTGD